MIELREESRWVLSGWFMGISVPNKEVLVLVGGPLPAAWISARICDLMLAETGGGSRDRALGGSGNAAADDSEKEGRAWERDMREGIAAAGAACGDNLMLLSLSCPGTRGKAGKLWVWAGVASGCSLALEFDGGTAGYWPERGLEKEIGRMCGWAKANYIPASAYLWPSMEWQVVIPAVSQWTSQHSTVPRNQNSNNV